MLLWQALAIVSSLLMSQMTPMRYQLELLAIDLLYQDNGDAEEGQERFYE